MDIQDQMIIYVSLPEQSLYIIILPAGETVYGLSRVDKEKCLQI